MTRKQETAWFEQRKIYINLFTAVDLYFYTIIE